MSVQSYSNVVLAAQQYIGQFVKLDEKGFVDSLADEVTCIHARDNMGFLSEFGKGQANIKLKK